MQLVKVKENSMLDVIGTRRLLREDAPFAKIQRGRQQPCIGGTS